MSRFFRHCALPTLLLISLVCPVAGLAAAAEASDSSAMTEDPARFVEFVLEDDANCQLRDAQHVLVHSTHPTRTIRVWMDRYYAGNGTGDRSRSDLAPHGDAEPLGCSKVMERVQEWRVVRAQFLD